MTVQEMIREEAARQGVDPALALAAAYVESRFNQGARGTSGEIGVFQLIPRTAASLGVDPYDDYGNIRGGVMYLRQMLAVCGGREDYALAAYNSGPDACTEGNIPPSAWSHAQRVLVAKGMFAGAEPEIPGGPIQPFGPVYTAGVGDVNWKTAALIVAAGLALLFLAD